MSIRVLTRGDAAAYRDVRARALREHPEAFSSDVASHEALTVADIEERLAGRVGTATFGAFDGARLVGICTLSRHARPKTRHAASVFGMYVVPAHPGRGTGRGLLRAAVGHARGIAGLAVVRLSVNPAARAARALYASEGFVPWGLERDAFRVDGEPQDEEHMRLEIGAPPPGSAPSA